jgi:type VI protein secretion system component VasK
MSSSSALFPSVDLGIESRLPIPVWLLIGLIIIALWIFCAIVHVLIAESRQNYKMKQEVERMRAEAKKISGMNISNKEQKEAMETLKKTTVDNKKTL